MPTDKNAPQTGSGVNRDGADGIVNVDHFEEREIAQHMTIMPPMAPMRTRHARADETRRRRYRYQSGQKTVCDHRRIEAFPICK